MLVIAVLLLGIFSAGAATLEVGPGKTYDTIQAAIDAAGTGDTIVVAAGTYFENLVISKSDLTLLGPNAGINPNTGTRIAEAILDGTGLSAGPGILLDGPSAAIDQNNVTIDGFEIRDYSGTAGIDRPNIGNKTSDNIAIRNNVIHSITGHGISFQRSGDAVLPNPGGIVIEDNLIADIGGTDKTGIIFYYNRAPETNPNYITGNTIDGTSYAAIQLNSSHNTVISGNNILNIPEQGIYLSTQCANIEISNNVITNANMLEESDKGGITFKHTHTFLGWISVFGNVITGSYNGVSIRDGYDISGKLITVNENRLTGNSNSGVYHGGTGVLDASSNWWGTTDPTVVAGVVGTGVDFSPMLDSGADGDVGTTGWQPDLSSVTVHTLGQQVGTAGRIQEGVNLAGTSTVNVAPGAYNGVEIDHGVTIQGALWDDAIIVDGVPYSSYTAGFLLHVGSDGTTISDLTILNGVSLAVYSNGLINDVTISDLTIYKTVQGITNWGGSGWQITNNDIIDTVALNGGGIGICIGVRPNGSKMSSDNLIQGNSITSDASAANYSCPDILLTMDLRYGRHVNLDGTEELARNQILDNTLLGNFMPGSSVGIEVGVIMTRIDESLIPILIQSTLGVITDTTIAGNTVLGKDKGLYLYTVANTNVSRNIIGNSTTGIYMTDGNLNNVFRYNSIIGNTAGFENTTGSLVDAALNWWGDNDGPSGEGTGAGDSVSTNVIFSPWLGIDPDSDPGTAGVQITGPMLIIVDDIGPAPADGYLNAAIAGSNELPAEDTIEVRHGTYSATEPITDGVTILSQVGSTENTFLNGALLVDAVNVIIGQMRQGFTLNGPITVGAGIDASTIHINWNDIYSIIT
ncbi:MAG: right-handed parallel beta-helix repeat-containing protein, partial [Deltaproteobacteria bacterium]|nr:right-handed parallel beta-helix repeat-containing protein [Deltaproteobacteria bacterium]